MSIFFISSKEEIKKIEAKNSNIKINGLKDKIKLKKEFKN